MDSQIEDIARGLSSCNIGSHEKIIIDTELKLLDVHCNWDLEQQRPNGDDPQVVVSELERKLKERIDISGFTFPCYCNQLVMAHELLKYNPSEGLKKIIECELWVQSLKSDDCKEKELIPIIEALQYIVMGCKAIALFKNERFAETKEILQNIPDYSRMNEKQKSGIYGVKACAYIEYGLQGFFKALEYISMARSMYPTMAEWHFLTGKIMSRIRHVKFPFMSVSDEEEKFIRTACKLNEDSTSYTLYFAQVTREKASGLFNEYRYGEERNEDILKRVNEMNEESSLLYKKLIDSNQNDSNVLSRAAFGMVKLPHPYRCISIAVKAIEQALIVSPGNPMAIHYAGLIYCRYVKDYDKALKYLELGAGMNNYPCLMDSIRLKYQLNPRTYNPIQELIGAFEFKDYLPTTYLEIASWYFFIENNLIEAWKYLQKISDEHSPRSHKSLFLRMNNACDIFEVMFDELKFKIAEEIYGNEQEKKTLMSISVELQKLCPTSHPVAYSNLKAAILEESNRVIQKENFNHNYRYTGERSRGRGGRNIARGREYSSHRYMKTDRNSRQDRGNKNEENITETKSDLSECDRGNQRRMMYHMRRGQNRTSSHNRDMNSNFKMSSNENKSEPDLAKNSAKNLTRQKSERDSTFRNNFDDGQNVLETKQASNNCDNSRESRTSQDRDYKQSNTELDKGAIRKFNVSNQHTRSRNKSHVEGSSVKASGKAQNNFCRTNSENLANSENMSKENNASKSSNNNQQLNTFKIINSETTTSDNYAKIYNKPNPVSKSVGSNNLSNIF